MKSDVVHLIVECRAFLWQPLGVEQLVHTRWPTEIFDHSCIRRQTYINSTLLTSPPAAFIDRCHTLRQSKVFCFVQPIMVCGRGALGGRNNAGWSWGPPLKTLAVLHHKPRAQLHRTSPAAGHSCCSPPKLNRSFTLGGQQKYLLMPEQRSQSFQLLYVHPLPRQA